MRRSCLLLLLLLLCPARADVLASVSFDGGKPFRVASIVPDGKCYLDVAALASAGNLRLVDRAGSTTVLVNGKTITDVLRYGGKTYVNAQALGEALDFDVRVKENNQVVDFWAKARGGSQAAATSLNLVLFRKDKATSATPDYIHLVLTVDVTNTGTQQVILNAKAFCVTDDRRQKTYASGDFDIPVAPGQRARVERLFFDVPSRASIKTLTVEGKDGQPVGTVKF